MNCSVIELLSLLLIVFNIWRFSAWAKNFNSVKSLKNWYYLDFCILGWKIISASLFSVTVSMFNIPGKLPCIIEIGKKRRRFFFAETYSPFCFSRKWSFLWICMPILSFLARAAFIYRLHDCFQIVYVGWKFQLGLFKPWCDFTSLCLIAILFLHYFYVSC